MRANANRAICATMNRFARLSALSLALAMVPACGKDSADPKPSPSAQAPLGAVPAPAGLVAELLVPKPGAVWVKVRALGGQKLGLAPASLPGAMGLFFGLPAMSIEQIDAEAPMTGVSLSQGDVDMPVFSMKLKDASRFVTALSGAPDARYSAKVDEATHVTVLTPKAGQSSLGPSLGVLGDRLLIAYAPDALLKAGPYAARTLPTRPMPQEDAVMLSPHDALAGPLRDRVKKFWAEVKETLETQAKEARKEKGDPDFGSPEAVVTQMDQQFQSLGVLLSDLAEARAIMTIDEWGLHVRAVAKPLSKDGPASAELAALTVGDLSPMYDLPGDTSFAALFRESEDIRRKNMVQQMQNVDRIFAGKLSDKERNTVRDLYEQWTKGRGEWLSIGGTFRGGAGLLYGQTEVRDETLIEKALKGTLDVPKIPAFGNLIASHFGAVKVSSPSALADLKGSFVKIDRAPPKPDDKKKGDDKKAKLEKPKDGSAKETLELGWFFDKALMTYVLGPSAKDLSTEVVKGRESGLRADAEVKRALDLVDKEKDASVALMVLPMRLVQSLVLKKGPPQKAEAAPILVVIGRTKDDGYLRVDAATRAVQELMNIRGAF